MEELNSYSIFLFETFEKRLLKLFCSVIYPVLPGASVWQKDFRKRSDVLWIHIGES